jgi:hypothetical protein
MSFEDYIHSIYQEWARLKARIAELEAENAKQEAGSVVKESLTTPPPPPPKSPGAEIAENFNAGFDLRANAIDYGQLLKRLAADIDAACERERAEAEQKAALLMAQAVRAEREACAKIADNLAEATYTVYRDSYRGVADAIRNRK